MDFITIKSNFIFLTLFFKCLKPHKPDKRPILKSAINAKSIDRRLIPTKNPRNKNMKK